MKVKFLRKYHQYKKDLIYEIDDEYVKVNLLDQKIAERIIENIENDEQTAIDEEYKGNHGLIICKGGHVSRDKYYELHVVVRANSKKEASDKARKCKRIKRDHVNGCLKEPTRITDRNALKIIEDNHKDKYGTSYSKYQCDDNELLHPERLKNDEGYIRDGNKKIKTNKFRDKKAGSKLKYR